jgi:hypothetical protein
MVLATRAAVLGLLIVCIAAACINAPPREPAPRSTEVPAPTLIVCPPPAQQFGSGLAELRAAEAAPSIGLPSGEGALVVLVLSAHPSATGPRADVAVDLFRGTDVRDTTALMGTAHTPNSGMVRFQSSARSRLSVRARALGYNWLIYEFEMRAGFEDTVVFHMQTAIYREC